jgi:hypothetical protein
MVVSKTAKESNMFNITPSDLKKKTAIQLADLFRLAALQSGKPDPTGSAARALLDLVRAEQARRELQP